MFGIREDSHPVERIRVLKDRVIANRQEWGRVGDSQWRQENAGQIWGPASIIKLGKVGKREHGRPESQVEETELAVTGTGTASIRSMP